MTPPKFLSDLYQDMRDRKLLPLVIALIAGIVAVPLLLSQEAEEPSPGDVAPVALPEGIPTAAVVVSNPGLRDYRERLDALRKKNPFASEPVKQKKSSKDAKVESLSESLPELAASGGGSTSVSETLTDKSSSTTNEVTITDSGSGGGGGNGGGDDDGGNQEPEILAFRIDVTVGPEGDTKRRKKVKLLTVLPSQSNPVAIFLGATEDGKRAVFLVSDDVATARGDGRCLPSNADCQFLEMKPKEKMTFGYAPSGEPKEFVLKLNDIYLDRNADTAGKSGRSGSDGKAGGIDGLEAWLGVSD